MKRISMVCIFSSLFTTLSTAQVSGIPGVQRLTSYEVVGAASDYIPSQESASVPLHREAAADYILLDQIELDQYILPGQRWAVSFQPGSHTLTLHPASGYAGLNPTALAAVARAPKWLQRDLSLNLSLLSADFQSLWAQAILDAQDPYIDEIAFSIAHSSPQYLMSGYGSPALFLDNARSIYANDAHLDYVQVVDHGSSVTDADYYTTTKYKSIHAGVVVDVEAPREVYYWYLVYPRATSEIPAYIDPALVEDNGLRNNNLAAPPAGVFWRDWLFNHADDGYPMLRESLQGCTVVFDGTRGKPDANMTAMGRLNTWMEKTLQFDSREERPHQPVRIYRVHMGRCGEWSDLRNAAARSALIPCTSVASYSTDHVWNEFWDREWYHWDNETNYPLMYIMGWGKVFGSVFEIRGDGNLTAVTPRYARGICYIDLYIKDANNKPVDGAEVTLYTKDLETSDLWWDMYAITDDKGMATFVVGKDRSYYVSINSAIGAYPKAGGVVEVVNGAISGRDYSKLIKLTGIKSAPKWTSVAPPADATSDYYLQVDFTAPAQLRNGAIRFDDVRLGSQLYARDEDGSIDFYFADSANFAAAGKNESFAAVGLLPDSLTGYGWMSLPAEVKWYAVFANEQNSRNVQQAAATVKLFGRAAMPARQMLDCTANWNWISFNVASASMRVADILASLGANGMKIRSSHSEAVYESGKGWNGSLTTLEAGAGYLLQLAQPQSFTISGPAVPVDQTIPLASGWNWIAYLPHVALPVEEALSSIADQVYQIKGQQHSAMYVDEQWIGDLHQLEPGQLYKINMKAAATLNWPNPQPALGKLDQVITGSQVLAGTPANMIVIARVGSVHVFDQVKIMDEQGRCRSHGVAIPGTSIYYFTIVGEIDGEKLSCELHDNASGWQTLCQQKIVFKDNSTLGTLAAPMNLSDVNLVFKLSQNHPNPFNQGTIINYTLPQGGEASLVVYNRLGQQVRVLFTGAHEAGQGTVVWDGCDGNGQPLAAGLYIAELKSGSYKKSLKMVLLR